LGITLTRQVLAAFREQPMHIFVDGTLGAGGHSSAVLLEHPGMQHLIGIDKDPAAHLIARRRLEQAREAAQSAVQIHRVEVRRGHSCCAQGT
jgi:16S rRNA (cytosine1402-N4)-methyltransferase